MGLVVILIQNKNLRQLIKDVYHYVIYNETPSDVVWQERMERNGRAYLEEQRKRHVDSVPMKDVPINTHLKATHDDSSQDARQTSPLWYLLARSYIGYMPRK